VQFFIWLLLQNRNWTPDWLRIRDWPHDEACTFYDQNLETASHINPTMLIYQGGLALLPISWDASEFCSSEEHYQKIKMVVCA
jgi:hypothetical protein